MREQPHLTSPSRWTLANELTAFRLLIAAPLMIALAVFQQPTWFLIVLCLSFLTDAIDGIIARWRGQTSRFGAMLDSWADVAAYCAISIGVLLLWPAWIRAEWLACSLIVASFVLPSIVGLVKFGQFTSYHTWLVKLAVASVAAGLLLALVVGPVWLFRIAALVATLAALEEIIISFMLDEPRSDVGGVYSVWRSRQSSDKMSH